MEKPPAEGRSRSAAYRQPRWAWLVLGHFALTSLGLCPTLGDDHSEDLPSIGKWYSSKCNHGHLPCAFHLVILAVPLGAQSNARFLWRVVTRGAEGSAAEPYLGTTVRASAHKRRELGR